MSLQNLCVSNIVNDFERYHTAFYTTQDVNLKRMLEFLQRVYSYEIRIHINARCAMKEKYTDFLINRYLKILDTYWFDNSTWETVESKIANIGNNIKEMHLRGNSEDRPWQKIFYYLPNLEVVHFHGKCIDKILMSIAKFCPNITEIDIDSSCRVTEKGIKSLCEKKNGKVACPKLKKFSFGSGKVACPKLKKLSLESHKVTLAAAIYLVKNLQSLEVFDYYYLPFILYSMHKEDLTKLDDIPPYNLTKLDLISANRRSPHFANFLKICISVCPFLTTLSCRLNEPQQLDLLGLSHLKTLHLSYDQRECLDINHLLKSKGSKLTSLRITNCSLSVSTLAENCPALKVLSMVRVQFEQHDGRSIPLFRNLDYFVVGETDFTNETHNLKCVCLILSSSLQLKSITVSKCPVTSELKTEILKCYERGLKKINLFSSYVDKPFVMDVLLTCHSLHNIFLKNCSLSDKETREIYEIYRRAAILPNRPRICILQQTIWDSD